MTATVRVELPSHLCRLGGCEAVLALAVEAPVTQRSVLDALERRCPALRGCVRAYETGLRRPFVRFFACGCDLSHLGPEELLPEEVAAGREPFLIVAAIAGG